MLSKVSVSHSVRGERGMSEGGYVKTRDLGYPSPLPQLLTPSGGHQSGRQAGKEEEINIL